MRLKAVVCVVLAALLATVLAYGSKAQTSAPEASERVRVELLEKGPSAEVLSRRHERPCDPSITRAWPESLRSQGWQCFSLGSSGLFLLLGTEGWAAQQNQGGRSFKVLSTTGELLFDSTEHRLVSTHGVRACVGSSRLAVLGLQQLSGSLKPVLAWLEREAGAFRVHAVFSDLGEPFIAEWAPDCDHILALVLAPGDEGGDLLSGDLYRFERSGGTRRLTRDLPLMALAWQPGGQSFVVSHGDRPVLRFFDASGHPTAVLPLPLQLNPAEQISELSWAGPEEMTVTTGLFDGQAWSERRLWRLKVKHGAAVQPHGK